MPGEFVYNNARGLIEITDNPSGLAFRSLHSVITSGDQKNREIRKYTLELSSSKRGFRLS